MLLGFLCCWMWFIIILDCRVIICVSMCGGFFVMIVVYFGVRLLIFVSFGCGVFLLIMC